MRHPYIAFENGQCVFDRVGAHALADQHFFGSVNNRREFPVQMLWGMPLGMSKRAVHARRDHQPCASLPMVALAGLVEDLGEDRSHHAVRVVCGHVAPRILVREHPPPRPQHEIRGDGDLVIEAAEWMRAH